MSVCVSNSDCNDITPICNTTRGICIECNFNTDCENGYSCQDNKCIEIPHCTEDVNCAEYYPYRKCKRGGQESNNVCVECIENENCTLFQKCENNRCVGLPNSPIECSQGCPNNYICVNGFCSEKNNSLLYIFVTMVGILVIILLPFFLRKRNKI